MNEQLHNRIRDLVMAVPAGKVSTYGDIAAIAGAKSARIVGKVLSEDGADLPWHRILRSNGTPSPHIQHQQLERLRAEGVLAQGNKVDLASYRWRP